MSWEIVGLVILAALLVTIVAVTVRRSMLSRTGAIDVSWRLTMTPDGRGWILGQGQYHGNELRLYRSFSPVPGAARRLRRDSLALGHRRPAEGTELDLLPEDVVIVRGTHDGTTLELALSEASLTGLKSWLESLPPGSRSSSGLFHRGTHRS